MAMLSPKQCHWPFEQKDSTSIAITRRIRKSSCTIVSSLLHFFSDRSTGNNDKI